METKQLIDIFLSNTFTKEAAGHRLALTKEFLEDYFFTKHENQNLIYLLNKFINDRNENRDEFNALFSWGYHFFDSFTKENFYSLIKNLTEEVQALPNATIYLAIVLPIYSLPKLSQWFRANVAPSFLIDVKFDRSLIAGCALVWKGTYYDFSLRYFLNLNKGPIKKIVDDYLPKSGAEIETGDRELR